MEPNDYATCKCGHLYNSHGEDSDCYRCDCERFDGVPLTPISKAELLAAFDDLGPGDTEQKHIKADYLLLRFIGDEDIANAFDALPKWYS